MWDLGPECGNQVNPGFGECGNQDPECGKQVDSEIPRRPEKTGKLAFFEAQKETVFSSVFGKSGGKLREFFEECEESPETEKKTPRKSEIFESRVRFCRTRILIKEEAFSRF